MGLPCLGFAPHPLFRFTFVPHLKNEICLFRFIRPILILLLEITRRLSRLLIQVINAENIGITRRTVVK